MTFFKEKKKDGEDGCQEKMIEALEGGTVLKNKELSTIVVESLRKWFSGNYPGRLKDKSIRISFAIKPITMKHDERLKQVTKKILG